MASASLATVSTVTLGGRTFRACAYCTAHLEWTIEELAKKHPGARLIVIQPPWNTGVPQSAGTHDMCSAFDVQIVGLGWWEAQRFLRAHRWAAFYRWFTPRLWSDHIHMLSLGCPAPKGDLVAGQIADYQAKPPRNGMKGHALDDSWHPADTRKTFNYDRWKRSQEDDMFTEADRKLLQQTHDAADRARKGSYKRDLRLIEEARKSSEDVDAILAKVDEGES
ncbi:hypothetical protein [Nocardioides sp. LHG3406-4]|uniref:hypothetical protein n=1 Tax=Nocardioides sp. LHG3406-4 TaxID=2804575 RepID=UPI003CF5B8BE